MNDKLSVMQTNPKGLKILFDHYQKLVLRGDFLEAIDLYYDPNIQQFENYQEPLVGKKLLRAKEEAVGQNMSSMVAQINNVLVDESKGMVWGRMKFVFESVELGRKILEEAFMQKWYNGKIIEQRFYYGGVKDQEK